MVTKSCKWFILWTCPVMYAVPVANLMLDTFSLTSILARDLLGLYRNGFDHERVSISVYLPWPKYYCYQMSPLIFYEQIQYNKYFRISHNDTWNHPFLYHDEKSIATFPPKISPLLHPSLSWSPMNWFWLVI